MPRPHPVVAVAPADSLIGQSPLMHTLRAQIRHLAAFDGVGKAAVPTVLLQGETGTGKGLVACVIHDSGPRVQGPFIEVNCAAIPETLLEAELFGFAAGSFSDAKRPKPGLFEAASGGTLFLDEVDALPLALQGKLLTALESKRVRRLGALIERTVDVKLVAATRIDLSGLVAAGQFRADLYHRLAVIVLALPPLRERGDDIVLLAQHLLQRHAESHGVGVKRLSEAAAAWLRSYDWPGNVRELSHLLERVTLLSADAIIDPDTLARLRLPRAMATPPTEGAPPLSAGVRRDEAAQIQQALKQTGGNVLQAARLLGLSRSTLRYRMVRCGLRVPRSEEAGTSRPVGHGAAMRHLEESRGGAFGLKAPEPTPRWEQKLVAVLAIDLSIHRATGLDISPDEAWTVLRRLERAIGEKAQTFGGVLLQRDMPPLLVAFGLPQALEQLPQRAVQAALAIRQSMAEAQVAAGREPVPEIQQAIHLGQLLVSLRADKMPLPYPAVGEPLSAAVRLLGQARPGEVVVCPQLGQMLRGWCELQACEMPQEAETPHRMRAFRVVGLASGHAPQAGLGARRLSPFVGRQLELALLRARLTQVQEGLGQVVGILGDPGMGKSRLLDEFRQRLARPGVTYLAGRCLSYGNTIPYLPVLDLLRDHCGISDTDAAEVVVAKVRVGLQEVGMAPDEWAPYLLHLLGVAAGTEGLAALPPEVLKARTFEALRQLCLRGGRQQRLILAVEDLQWIDQTSEEFLTFLVERTNGAHILLLTTYRPGYRPPWLGNSSVTQLVLPPLGPQDSWSLIRSVIRTESIPTRLGQQILAKAEGNPLFLEAIVQTLVEQRGTDIQLPPTVQTVLAARIDQLPAAAKALLQTLAVLGRECSWRLLTQVVDQPDEALRRWLAHLQKAEFLDEQSGLPEPTYRFKHALVKDVAYASLPQERRQRLHDQAAQAIEGLFHDRLAEHSSELAYHYRRSGNSAKAAEYVHLGGNRPTRALPMRRPSATLLRPRSCSIRSQTLPSTTS